MGRRIRLSIKMNRNDTASSRWQHSTVLGQSRRGSGKGQCPSCLPYPLPPFSNLPPALGGSLGLSIAGFGQWKGNKRTSLPCWFGHLGPTVCLVQTIACQGVLREASGSAFPVNSGWPRPHCSPTAPCLELPCNAEPRPLSKHWSQHPNFTSVLLKTHQIQTETALLHCATPESNPRE